jgi:hypothetical protein
VSVAHILSSSSKPLHGVQDRLWSQAVRDLKLDLDPYTCKASYVCGMLRQFIEAAGLQLGCEYHVGALVSAASAAELVGWCCKGTTSTDHPGKRLGDGVWYLQEVGPPYHGSIHQPATDLAGWVRNVRNFGAHGAAHSERLALDRVLTVRLLRSLLRHWTSSGPTRATRVGISASHGRRSPPSTPGGNRSSSARCTTTWRRALCPACNWTTRRLGVPVNPGRSRHLRAHGQWSIPAARQSPAAHDGCSCGTPE